MPIGSIFIVIINNFMRRQATFDIYYQHFCAPKIKKTHESVNRGYPRRTFRDVCGAGANPDFGITGHVLYYSVLRFIILIV